MSVSTYNARREAARDPAGSAQSPNEFRALLLVAVDRALVVGRRGPYFRDADTRDDLTRLSAYVVAALNFQRSLHETLSCAGAAELFEKVPAFAWPARRVQARELVDAFLAAAYQLGRERYALLALGINYRDSISMENVKALLSRQQ